MKLTDVQIEDIAILAAKDKTAQEIADEVGCSKNLVGVQVRKLAAAGLPIKLKRQSSVRDYAEIAEGLKASKPGLFNTVEGEKPKSKNKKAA